MPSWTYECDSCGWKSKEWFAKGEDVPDYKPCALCHTHAYNTWGRKRIGMASSAAWPMVSEAAGVAPNQIADARRADEMAGVPCDFTPDGGRIFRDRGHRRDWLRANGWWDKSGGYGD